jgi:hypothetical protein
VPARRAFHDAVFHDEHRNQLYKLIQEQKGQQTSSADLGLPAWDRFVQLFRQLLDAPTEVSQTPLILREVGFAMLRGSSDHEFARQLCAASPQAARFSVLVVDYLCKAAKLPPEFQASIEKILLALQPGR